MSSNNSSTIPPNIPHPDETSQQQRVSDNSNEQRVMNRPQRLTKTPARYLNAVVTEFSSPHADADPTYNPHPSYSQTKSGPDKEKWHQAEIQEFKI